MSIVMPYDNLLEQKVLGAMLFGGESCAHVFEVFSAHMMYSDLHSAIYEEIERQILSGVNVNAETVASRMPAHRQYICDVAFSVISWQGIEELTKTLKDLWRKREMIRFSVQLREMSEGCDPDEMTSFMEDFVIDLHSKQKSSNLNHIGASMSDTLRKFERIMAGELVGMSTGVPVLDKLLMGLEADRLYVLGGRGGTGKTALAMEVARRCGGKVAFFSLEMGKAELIERFVCSESGIQNRQMRYSDSLTRNQKQIMDSMGALSLKDIWIDDTPGTTVERLVSSCRVQKMKSGLDLIIVDYLQYLKLENSKRMNRYEVVSTVSHKLKEAAKILHTPILALSALNRGKDEDARPTIDNLRETGQIEYDAHAILLLHRYKKNVSMEVEPIEALVVKHRSGPEGYAEMGFDKARGRFLDAAPENPDGF